MTSPLRNRLSWWHGLLLFGVLLPLFTLALATKKTEEQRNKLTEEQRQRIFKAALACSDAINNTLKPTDGMYCEAVFDNIQCWNYTLAGTVVSKPCPAFIVNFNPNEISTRVCLENGTWGPSPFSLNNTRSSQQKGWTNYMACLMKPTTPVMPRFIPGLIKEHMPVIALISKVGYSISLFSLIIATFIMIMFKRLHCQRNVIHINLFITFILRAVICLLRDSLLVQNLGLPQDVQYDEDGDIEFNPHGPHWQCKLLFTLFQWALASNYMWVFVEGLYLHTLIFFAVFYQKAIFKLYIIIGWATPFAFVIPWVLARIFYNNTLCWNTHERGYYWIMKGFIITTICVNFVFFLNIIRALYTKLRRSTYGESQRYRKLAKSTLVLIPLFGVYYIFFIVVTNHQHSDPRLTVGIIYSEMTLNSFQGMVVAVLFCFMNGEVRAEIAKNWQRHMLRRQSVASLRSNRAMSTTSFLPWSRGDRSSISGPTRRGSKFPNADSSISLRSMENGHVRDRGPGGKEAGTGSRFPVTQSSPSLRSIGELNSAANAAVGDSRERGRSTLEIPLASLSPLPSPPCASPTLSVAAPQSCGGGSGSSTKSSNGDEDEGTASKETVCRRPTPGSTSSLCSIDSNGSAGGVITTIDTCHGEGGGGSEAASAAGNRGAAGAEWAVTLSSNGTGRCDREGPTLPCRPVVMIRVADELYAEKQRVTVSSNARARCRINVGNSGNDRCTTPETTPMMEKDTVCL